MYFTESKENQINDILNRITEKLQLDNTRKERVERSYLALCKWIEDDEDFFGNFATIKFYPQGSYSIQTNVKPLKGNEFDLDFVLELSGDWNDFHPLDLLFQLNRRFKEHETYKDMKELKNRCVRINYANDFHIDILPSFPLSLYSNDTKLKVPDKNEVDWADSNPKGYSIWFESMCNKATKIILEKKALASVEPLPDSPYSYVNPLIRAVQLMKRYRDVYFQADDSTGVKSIVLTTLAGHYYYGESSEYLAINNILDRIIIAINNTGKKPLEIFNPTNPDEKLSEKWDESPEDYLTFCTFIKTFKNQWRNIFSLPITESSKILKDMFGENIITTVLKEHSEYINKLRENDT
ncbi:MAG: nucleotidyltransferase domain-containing protein, partial [Clostridium sp.]